MTVSTVRSQEKTAKEAVRGWDEGGRPVPREALCVVYERPRQLTWLVTVTLDETARVTTAVPAPGVFPLVTGEQFKADSERIKQAPAFQAALARRGLTDMSAVHVDDPVMPVEYTGFTLKPFGFFDRNPAIDLAPSASASASAEDGHCHP